MSGSDASLPSSHASLPDKDGIATSAARAGVAVRSAVAAVDYQLRGLGSLTGFLLAAALPPDVAIWVAIACYACAAALALRHGRETGRDDTADAVEGAPGPLVAGRGEHTVGGGSTRLGEAEAGRMPSALWPDASSAEPTAGASLSPPARRRRRSPLATARALGRRWGGLTTLCCALVAFVYQARWRDE